MYISIGIKTRKILRIGNKKIKYIDFVNEV